MKITHLALWTETLEKIKQFYITYFDGNCNEKYTNPTKGFESYFIRFDGDVSIEIMQSVNVSKHIQEECIGYCHLAFSLGSKIKVCELTERLRHDGYTIAGEPRITGDGYFESVILDPDGNRIELTE